MNYQYQDYQLVQDHIVQTPVISNADLDKELKAQLFFKCENLQCTGSFKYRGAMYALLKLDAGSRAKGVVTVSSGNHGAALARAGQTLGIQVTVIVPKDINPVKLNNIQQYSAEIIFADSGMQGRQEALAQFFSCQQALFIPPYNHHDIVFGQASSAYELIEQQPDLDYLIVPIGGGGLASGSILAAQTFNSRLKVVGAEPANADDAFQSMLTGKLIEHNNPDTVCDGLKASLGDLTFPIIRDGIEDIMLVSEQDIIAAMKYLHQKLKMLIEPSSAIVYAAVLKHKQRFENKKVGLILSGGNLDLEKFYSDC